MAMPTQVLSTSTPTTLYGYAGGSAACPESFDGIIEVTSFEQLPHAEKHDEIDVRLAGSKINSEQFLKLVDFIEKKAAAITMLDLSNCSLTTDMLRSILTAFAKQPDECSLHFLLLTSNSLKDEDALLIADFLPVIARKTLPHHNFMLNLDDNLLTCQGAIRLIERSSETGTRGISMQNNELNKNADLRALLRFFMDSPLEILRIGGNDLPTQAIMTMQPQFPPRKQLYTH